MTTPLPTNRPAPITPPSAIMCMCRRCSARRSPLEAESGAVIGGTAAGYCTQVASHEFLVFREVPHRLRQGVTAERVTELLRHHHFQHGRLAGALCGSRGAQRGGDVGEPLEADAIAAERARHGGPAGVLQIDPLVAPRVEVDVILLLRAPLFIVEDDHRHADLLAHAGEQLGVTVIVFNNEQWGAEKKNHVDFYSRRYQGVNLQNPSWAAVARAFGCEGVALERLADVTPALHAAAAAQSAGKTTVLEVMVTQELGDPFRRDALSKPVRHLAKYQKFM